jgi:integrase
LPPKVFGALADKAELTRQNVAHGIYALAVEIELHVPIRGGNLCDLQLGLQLQLKRSGASDIASIILETTKNGDAYESVLSGEAVRWLKFYLQHIRPKITSLDSSALFPNEHGQFRHKIAFSRGIAQFVEREIGVHMTTHIFRHLAVRLQQRFNPGDTETPRALLGHRNHATINRSYAVADVAAAAKRHDALISTLRERNAVDASKATDVTTPRGRR